VTAGDRLSVSLVLDAAAGTLKGYADGVLFGTATGVGTLYRHENAIGMGDVASESRDADGTLSYAGNGFEGSIFSASSANAALDSTQVASLHADFATRFQTDEPTQSPSPYPNDFIFRFDASTLPSNEAPLTLEDISGQGHAAVAETSRTADVAGGGLAFDGSDVYHIANSAALNVGGPYNAKTLSFVVELGQDVTTRQFLYEQGGTARGLSLSIEDGALHMSGWNLAETAWGVTTVSTDVAAGDKLAVSLVFDATAGRLQGFVDGTLVGTADGVGLLHSHGNEIGLGGVRSETLDADGTRVTGGVEGFRGTLFEAAGHNRALGADDVAALHAEFASNWGLGTAAAVADGDPAPELASADAMVFRDFDGPRDMLSHFRAWADLRERAAEAWDADEGGFGTLGIPLALSLEDNIL
jgi:hypothetical protein